MDQSSNQSNVDINPENTDIQSEHESQRSTEIDLSVPCQSSSSASRMKKKMIRSKFDCEVCQKRCKVTKDLVFHRRIHLNDVPVYCRNCFRSFATKAARDAHENKCDYRRYECYLCGRFTSSKPILVIHMRIHSGQRPYKCNICNEGFNQQSTLVSHHGFKHSKLKIKFRVTWMESNHRKFNKCSH